MTETTADRPISELYATVAEWVGARGDEPSKWPGVWSATLDEYVIHVNAHREPNLSADRIELPPFGMCINAPKYLGAMILLDPFGGVGAAGMEDDVLAALRADIDRMAEPTHD